MKPLQGWLDTRLSRNKYNLEGGYPRTRLSKNQAIDESLTRCKTDWGPGLPARHCRDKRVAKYTVHGVLETTPARDGSSQLLYPLED
jgi:hypothetical protein